MWMAQSGTVGRFADDCSSFSSGNRDQRLIIADTSALTYELSDREDSLRS